MYLQAITGEETTATGSCKVQIFHRIKADGEERPLHIAARDMHSGIRIIGQPIFVSAVEGDPTGMMGKWIEARYEVQEGSYVKVFMSKKPKGQMGYDRGSVLLHMREDAALNRIRISFTGDTKAHQTAGYVEGNFDTVYQDMFENLGIPTDQYSDYCDPLFKEDLYAIHEQERERRPWIHGRVTSTFTAKGKTVLINKARGGRRINMDRK